MVMYAINVKCTKRFNFSKVYSIYWLYTLCYVIRSCCYIYGCVSCFSLDLCLLYLFQTIFFMCENTEQSRWISPTENACVNACRVSLANGSRICIVGWRMIEARLSWRCNLLARKPGECGSALSDCRMPLTFDTSGFGEVSSSFLCLGLMACRRNIYLFIGFF